MSAIPKSPIFHGRFLSNIRKMYDAGSNLEQISLKGIYDFLMSDMLRTEIETLHNEMQSPRVDWPLTPLRCELNFPNTD